MQVGWRQGDGKRAGVVLGLCLTLWLAMHHGAIRSPDAETQLRACEAIAETGSAAVAEELPWRGFGLATGQDGQRYSVFGPLQPALCAPWYALASALSGGWQRGPFPGPLRPSLYADGHIKHHIRREPLADPPRHRRRSWASLFNVGVGLLAVAAFAWALLPLVGGPAAWAGALLLGLATPLWHYSGTFFSEPLAMLCLHGSLGCALRVPGRRWMAGGAGLLLGLAITAHITAVFSGPGLAALALWRSQARGRDTALFGLGAALPLLAMAGLYQARYGDPLETGRHVDASAARRLKYGAWADHTRGFAGLLVSARKGLLLFAPLTALGVALAPRLRDRVLLAAIALSFLLRWLFIGARTDWHGGFGLGPRLMLTVVPFLLIPIAAWLAEGGARRWALAAGAAFLAGAQQMYFVLGEPFALVQVTWWSFIAMKRPAFANDELYLAWDVSPLLHLHASPPGPWWSGAAYAEQIPGRWLLVLAAGALIGGALWWLQPQGQAQSSAKKGLADET